MGNQYLANWPKRPRFPKPKASQRIFRGNELAVLGAKMFAQPTALLPMTNLKAAPQKIQMSNTPYLAVQREFISE
jgi:hypothetical protein